MCINGANCLAEDVLGCNVKTGCGHIPPQEDASIYKTVNDRKFYRFKQSRHCSGV